jgi:FkbM family methyltransferase
MGALRLSRSIASGSHTVFWIIAVYAFTYALRDQFFPAASISDAAAGGKPMIVRAKSCTRSQRKRIKTSLNARIKGVLGKNGKPMPDLVRCKHHDYGWLNRCPLSHITGCPKKSWLERYYQEATTSANFVAVNVGCNKGYDAVNFLRMGLNDNSVSLASWKAAMPSNMKEGVCKQEVEDDQYHVKSSDTAPTPTATVYCVEPVPATYQALKAAQESTGYGSKGLRVLQYALNNDQPGHTLFSNATVGAEKQGLNKCDTRDGACESVKTSKLDTLLKEQDMADTRIDVLLIDVEGWDFEVLKGASKTLEQTAYVEFEYNWRGKWGEDQGNKPLLKAVTFLKYLDFTCYWPGKDGELWKLTGCWDKDYGGLYWANVACVNRKLSLDLAVRMEEHFLSTISTV